MTGRTADGTLTASVPRLDAQAMPGVVTGHARGTNEVAISTVVRGYDIFQCNVL